MKPAGKCENARNSSVKERRWQNRPIIDHCKDTQPETDAFESVVQGRGCPVLPKTGIGHLTSSALWTKCGVNDLLVCFNFYQTCAHAARIKQLLLLKLPTLGKTLGYLVWVNMRKDNKPDHNESLQLWLRLSTTFKKFLFSTRVREELVQLASRKEI